MTRMELNPRFQIVDKEGKDPNHEGSATIIDHVDSIDRIDGLVNIETTGSFGRAGCFYCSMKCMRGSPMYTVCQERKGVAA